MKPTDALPLSIVSPAELARPPGPGDLLIRPPPGQRQVALARQLLLEGPGGLPQGRPPLRRVLLPPNPALDDLLCGWLLARPGGESPPRLELLCDYAAQLREGLLPGSVAAERSLGGLYLALVELHREHPGELLRRGGLLLQAAVDGLAAGGSLLHDDLFSSDDRFAREHTYLAADRERYARDRSAGQVLPARVGRLPARLLCLVQPTSILFRLFAFREGFDLVLVQRGQHVALWADPTRRLPLGQVLPRLCHELGRLEGDAAEPWYDGVLHGHQRLASPRRGTRLSRAEFMGRILHALGARRRSLWPLALLLCLFVSPLPLGEGPAQTPSARGDWQAHRLPAGPAASSGERRELLAGTIRNWAVIVAASAYQPRSTGGLGALRTPWRDACAIRELLVRRFGYQRGDIITLADSSCLRGVAGPPTRQQLLWTVEHLPIQADDTLLFYYAGHGAIEEEPGGRYGYLQPGGWEQPGLSREDRGLRMRVLAELLRDKVAARHQLLLIDACHSGEAAVVRGSDPLDRLEAPVRAGWRRRPVYAVITAAGADDLALEERLLDSPYPHSLFTRALLEGLSFTPSGPPCRLRADQDPPGAPDGLITDGELFKYVARRVPELRAALHVPGLPEAAQQQVPEWNPWAAAPRGGGADVRIGEFLLIPRQSPAACTETPEPEPEECRVCRP